WSGHVRKHDVGRPAECFLDQPRRLGREHVSLNEGDSIERLHLEDIDADHAPRRTDPLGCDLAPSAGSGAEIEHPGALLQEMKLVVELEQLERGAAAIAPGLCGMNVWIVDLSLKPTARRRRETPAVLDPRTDLSATGLAGGHRRTINSRSMPSRKPRSATR